MTDTFIPFQLWYSFFLDKVLRNMVDLYMVTNANILISIMLHAWQMIYISTLNKLADLCKSTIINMELDLPGIHLHPLQCKFILNSWTLLDQTIRTFSSRETFCFFTFTLLAYNDNTKQPNCFRFANSNSYMSRKHIR